MNGTRHPPTLARIATTGTPITEDRDNRPVEEAIAGRFYLRRHWRFGLAAALFRWSAGLGDGCCGAGRHHANQRRLAGVLDDQQ